MTMLIMLGSFALGLGLANKVAFADEFQSLKSQWWRVGAFFLPPIIAALLLGAIA